MKSNLNIFLDIDGVLNNHSAHVESVSLVSDKIQLLNFILFKYLPNIIISSSWLLEYDKETIKIILERSGLRYSDIFYDAIDYRDGELSKEEAIENYIKSHLDEYNIFRYVIIDDEFPSSNELKTNLIYVDNKAGLTYKNIYYLEKKLIKLEQI